MALALLHPLTGHLARTAHPHSLLEHTCSLAAHADVAHTQARWICVLAASDTKLEVRDEGARGLRLFPVSLNSLEPAPLTPTPSLSAEAATVSSPPSAAAAGGAHEPMAVDSEGSSSTTAAGGDQAPNTASAALAASAAPITPERRPDLVALLRYVVRQAPALLPADAFGTRAPAADAARAAAMQRAQGAGAGGTATSPAGLPEEGCVPAPDAQDAPMPDPARTLPIKPRWVGGR